jgi:hypothetical protein
LEPVWAPARGERVFNRGFGFAADVVLEETAAACVVVAAALLLDDELPPQALTARATPSAASEPTIPGERSLEMSIETFRLAPERLLT